MIITKIVQYYSKLSNWGKILLFSIIFIVVVSTLNNLVPSKKTNGVEGFSQDAGFTHKTDIASIYDDFYANIF